MASAPAGVLAWILKIIWMILFVYIGLPVGRAIMWIVSLGHYPTKHPTRAQDLIMFLIGVIAVFAALVAIRNLIWP